MNNTELDFELRKKFTHEKPFGPTNAANLLTHPELFSRTIDPQSKITKRFRNNPSIIIGRRGSGKTTFLFGVVNHAVCESLSSAKIFSDIVRAINTKADTFIFHENVADLWEHLFTLALFRKTSQKFNKPAYDLAILKDYCSKNGLGDEGSIEDWLWRIVRIAKTKVRIDTIASVADIVTELTGANFQTAKKSFIEILKYNDARALLQIDSLDQYPINIDQVAHSISGLLMCVGEFNERNERYHVRVCLPAELYFDFLRLSPNPLKTFGNSITLHWHALELLSIIANRLRIYLSLHYPEYEVLRDDIIEPKNAVPFLMKFLPEKVKNDFNVEEKTIPYILRHTQLMPRQLLRIFNSIFHEAYSADFSLFPNISSDYIVIGIRKAEVGLVDEVCSAYAVRYPNLNKTLESIIPHLTYRFTHGELQKIHKRHGKKSSGMSDIVDFKRMLIETAVVGRVIQSPNELYTQANFEYTAANRLVTSTEDDLCLHPIFAEVYHFKRDTSSKPVYPFGTDPYSPDYRENEI